MAQCLGGRRFAIWKPLYCCLNVWVGGVQMMVMNRPFLGLELETLKKILEPFTP